MSTGTTIISPQAAEAAVKREWPDAHCVHKKTRHQPWGNTEHYYYCMSDRTRDASLFSADNWPTEDEAWLDAYSRLPESARLPADPQPASTPTCMVDERGLTPPCEHVIAGDYCERCDTPQHFLPPDYRALHEREKALADELAGWLRIAVDDVDGWPFDDESPEQARLALARYNAARAEEKEAGNGQ